MDAKEMADATLELRQTGFFDHIEARLTATFDKLAESAGSMETGKLIETMQDDVK